MNNKKLDSIIEKVLRFVRDPDYRFMNLVYRGFYKSMPDDEYLKRMFHARMGYELNLNNPQTFNEKLQWLKLYDRKPEYTQMVDKYESKQYVADIIGEEYVIPALGVWNTFDEINFTKLPDQFVLKCTHDSGGLVICKDKNSLDISASREKINKCLNRSFYDFRREWPYKDVRPRIIAENYLSDNSEQLTDYKVHCFHGKPEIILVCKDRFSADGMSEDFFTVNWDHIPVHRPNVRYAAIQLEKPDKLQYLLDLSKKLSSGIPFLRCDFYIIAGNIYLGELTFYPASGFKAFVPESYDAEFGSLIHLDHHSLHV